MIECRNFEALTSTFDPILRTTRRRTLETNQPQKNVILEEGRTSASFVETLLREIKNE
jgi:hypothetical protein